MRIFKLKIFDLQLMQYVSILGNDTWFTYSEVAKAYTSLITKGNELRYEIHDITLTKTCLMED